MAKKEPQGKAPTVKKVLEDVLEVLHETSHTSAEEVDVDQLLHQLQGSLDELTERAEQIYQATGMTKEQLEEFAENPKNFSEEEWKLLGDVKDEIRHMREEADKIFENKPELAALAKEKPKKKGPKKKWMKT